MSRSTKSLKSIKNIDNDLKRHEKKRDKSVVLKTDRFQSKKIKIPLSKLAPKGIGFIDFKYQNQKSNFQILPTLDRQNNKKTMMAKSIIKDIIHQHD